MLHIHKAKNKSFFQVCYRKISSAKLNQQNATEKSHILVSVTGCNKIPFFKKCLSSIITHKSSAGLTELG